MKIRDVREFLSGKKTYLVGIALIVYSVGVRRGWWPNDIQIWGLLGGTGVMTVRAAITKLCLQFADDKGLKPDAAAAAPSAFPVNLDFPNG